ncbi:unnamed protein product [Ectocarpus sp. 12 AP-2014]
MCHSGESRCCLLGVEFARTLSFDVDVIFWRGFRVRPVSKKNVACLGENRSDSKSKHVHWAVHDWKNSLGQPPAYNQRPDCFLLMVQLLMGVVTFVFDVFELQGNWELQVCRKCPVSMEGVHMRVHRASFAAAEREGRGGSEMAVVGALRWSRLDLLACVVGACVVRASVSALTWTCYTPFRALCDRCQSSRQLPFRSYTNGHGALLVVPPPPLGELLRGHPPIDVDVFGVGFTPTRLHKMSVRARVFALKLGVLVREKKIEPHHFFPVAFLFVVRVAWVIVSIVPFVSFLLRNTLFFSSPSVLVFSKPLFYPHSPHPLWSLSERVWLMTIRELHWWVQTRYFICNDGYSSSRRVYRSTDLQVSYS